ncbi:GNAT family N-acetyltransferase [Ginsengibacter hankyongi]|uniref:GNAT family N-acetyltransferase n=1 Tax=Ginsengibacter hankyongi TaxID=2607284 RepID=A0A5J5IKX5_9BACT|nr:GNAT family N-acetyltransferase [Ginsengibacter hankyongi]KAA9041023.1 GNAT family N-acetyltransferase [Ginsengibacter hankyongi]
MIFETKRLYATKWQPRDLKALHELYNDPAITEFILPALTLEETRHIFEDQLNRYRSHYPFGRYFIVEKMSNKFIGLLLFKKDHKKAGVEIGYSLIKNQWHKGYATEIVKESINWLFEQDRFFSISAITELHNEGSKNVLLKCGFRPQQTFMEYGEEMNLFGLLKEDQNMEYIT